MAADHFLKRYLGEKVPIACITRNVTSAVVAVAVAVAVGTNVDWLQAFEPNASDATHLPT